VSAKLADFDVEGNSGPKGILDGKLNAQILNQEQEESRL
jgi:hypothetical protein